MRISRRKSSFKIIKKHLSAAAAVLLLSFFIFQAGLGNAFSGRGGGLKDLEQKKQSLIKENESLRAEIAWLGSLERIRQEAGEKLRMGESGSRLDYLVPPKLAWR